MKDSKRIPWRTSRTRKKAVIVFLEINYVIVQIKSFYNDLNCILTRTFMCNYSKVIRIQEKANPYQCLLLTKSIIFSIEFRMITLKQVSISLTFDFKSSFCLTFDKIYQLFAKFYFWNIRRYEHSFQLLIYN